MFGHVTIWNLQVFLVKYYILYIDIRILEKSLGVKNSVVVSCMRSKCVMVAKILGIILYATAIFCQIKERGKLKS